MALSYPPTAALAATSLARAATGATPRPAASAASEAISARQGVGALVARVPSAQTPYRRTSRLGSVPKARPKAQGAERQDLAATGTRRRTARESDPQAMVPRAPSR